MFSELKEIYPIDNNGFIIWKDEKHRYESMDYKPKHNEIDAPIPIDQVFYKHKWNGYNWIEGGIEPEESIAKPSRIDILEEVVQELLLASLEV